LPSESRYIWRWLQQKGNAEGVLIKDEELPHGSSEFARNEDGGIFVEQGCRDLGCEGVKVGAVVSYDDPFVVTIRHCGDR
jgi:hypothetical protein